MFYYLWLVLVTLLNFASSRNHVLPGVQIMVIDGNISVKKKTTR